MSDKVSIVVPIYKVAKYLNRCVDSLLNQTYENIEVILVDDGSPDKSGEIADHYAEIDKRIIVIHKTNGGLSDARNTGIQYVTGEYTLFVDSDDWLQSKMIEEMVDKSIYYGADVVQSAFYYAYADYLLFDNRQYSKNDEPVVLENHTLMSELVKNEKVKNFAWGKLLKTKIIRDIPFDKGVLFEDVFWAHKVMHRVNTYVILHQPLYYYFQRSDSIVANYTPKNLDIIKGLKERHRFIERYYEDLKDESLKLILKTCLIHYNLLLVNWKKDKGGLCRKKIQQYIKKNYIQLKEAAKSDIQLKRQLSLFRIHPYLNVSFLIVNKGLRKMKIKPQPIGLERVKV
jgi:glycosyltransferase involved in cell wall biosynthesis